jgi:sugar phosphate isomerase/epimerase
MVPHTDVRQIPIGTCVPGFVADAWAPHMIKAGFETLSINFHMELGGVDLETQGPKLKAMLDGTGCEITTLGYYCNPIQYDEHRRTLERVIDAAALYGAKVVSTFAGGYEGKSVDESIKAFGAVFGDLAKRCEDKGLKLAIENCPMGGTWDRLTCNLGFNPRAWTMMFNEVPSPALGLEWEPAHQMIQLIDPIAQLRKWTHKVHHVHGKDATVDVAAIRENGVLCDTDWYAPERTPGFGDCNWRDIIYILYTGGYDGDICVEGYHDPIYRNTLEMTAQLHALNYLKWCRGGDFTPNPWEDKKLFYEQTKQE